MNSLCACVCVTIISLEMLLLLWRLQQQRITTTFHINCAQNERLSSFRGTNVIIHSEKWDCMAYFFLHVITSSGLK